jgi:hypothetical protein
MPRKSTLVMVAKMKARTPPQYDDNDAAEALAIASLPPGAVRGDKRYFSSTSPSVDKSRHLCPPFRHQPGITFFQLILSVSISIRQYRYWHSMLRLQTAITLKELCEVHIHTWLHMEERAHQMGGVAVLINSMRTGLTKGASGRSNKVERPNSLT